MKGVNLIEGKARFILLAAVLFFILLTVSCSKKGYVMIVDDVTVDGSECTFHLSTEEEITEDLTVLFTEDHEPKTADDGYIYNNFQFTHTFTESGTKTIYLTFVNKSRLVSQPLKRTIEILPMERLTHFEYQLENSVLKIHVFPKLDNTIYTVEINGTSYKSNTGELSIPVKKEDIVIKASAVQNDEVKYRSIKTTISADADEPPSVSIPLPENGYNGKWIPFHIIDDWDNKDDLNIKAEVKDISLLYNDEKLFPEYEIPEGNYTLEASVIDSYSNVSTVSKSIRISKTFEEHIPELYIEEGGYFRIASWKNVDNNTEVKIERFKNGKWEEIIKTKDHSPLRISSEFVSDSKGDLYRLSLASTKTHYLPSVPVYAKSEPLRRLTSTYVLSLMGADTLFSAGEEYYLQGRIAVGEKKHLRIEPEVTVKIGRGSSLLVNGSIEMDGRRGRINFIPLASSVGIRVGSGGVMLARNVDFGNTSITGEEGSVIILEDCNINNSLGFSGRYLQIYNSDLNGGLNVENSDEIVVSNTLINEHFNSNNVKKSMFVNSNINCEIVTTEFSKINFYQSEFETEEMSVKNIANVNFYHCEGLVDIMHISNGSRVYVDTGEFWKSTMAIEKISTAVLPEKLRDIIVIEADDKSNVVFY